MYRDFDNDFNLMDYSIGEWSHWTEQGDTARRRCNKILVTLDRSFEATERVLRAAKEMMAPGGEGILLHVIPPAERQDVGAWLHVGTGNGEHRTVPRLRVFELFR